MNTDAPERTRVLVVDDDDDNRHIVTRYLELSGHDVLAVSNGLDALAQLGQLRISLVVLDMHMPGMDGLEVCRRIRARAEWRKIPIIFLTAAPVDDALEQAALEAGGDEYLHRPVSRRTLTLRVRNLLRLADAERDRQILVQVAQSEKLAAIGQVAAGVAHEINNPLAFVLSNLGTLRDYVGSLTQALEAWQRSAEEGRAIERRLGIAEVLTDVQPIIDETLEGGERMRSIVRELKSFMRGQDDAPERVNLAEVARSTLVLTERDLSLRAELVRSLDDAWVEHAPRQRLHQVVLNLLINARQALETRQLAEGERHRIEVTTRNEGDCAVLSVSDSGGGISDEVRERLFEPFFTTKPVGVGVGLGLPLCAMVVDQVGGTIEVDSRVGEGARFTLRIPHELPIPSSKAVTENARGVG